MEKNLLFGGRYLREGRSIFGYVKAKPSANTRLGEKFEDGIAHGASTVTDFINIGAIVGFRHIVVCGVDLYDRMYFLNVPGARVAPMPSVTAGVFVKRDIHHHLFLRLAINQLGDRLIATLSCCLKGLVAFLRTDSNFGCS